MLLKEWRPGWAGPSRSPSLTDLISATKPRARHLGHPGGAFVRLSQFIVRCALVKMTGNVTGPAMWRKTPPGLTRAHQGSDTGATRVVCAPDTSRSGECRLSLL